MRNGYSLVTSPYEYRNGLSGKGSTFSLSTVRLFSSRRIYTSTDWNLGGWTATFSCSPARPTISTGTTSRSLPHLFSRYPCTGCARGYPSTAGLDRLLIGWCRPFMAPFIAPHVVERRAGDDSYDRVQLIFATGRYVRRAGFNVVAWRQGLYGLVLLAMAQRDTRPAPDLGERCDYTSLLANRRPSARRGGGSATGSVLAVPGGSVIFTAPPRTPRSRRSRPGTCARPSPYGAPLADRLADVPGTTAARTATHGRGRTGGQHPPRGRSPSRYREPGLPAWCERRP
jgi:hypothetical protein